MSYKVQRVYLQRPGQKRTIMTGLSLEQAQAHCQDQETSSSTCTKSNNVRRTKQMGMWFDCYTEE